MTGPEHGRSFDSAILERGLMELCPDLHFDLAGKIDQIHPFINDRQGVYYKGKHICSMDRGPVPEFKLWSVKTVIAERPWADADKDDVSVQFRTIVENEEGYEDLREIAVKGSDPSINLLHDGRICKRQCMGPTKVRGRCIRLGWRHTIEKIIAANLPGLDRMAIARKLSVDLLKYPVGDPDELVAALVEE